MLRFQPFVFGIFPLWNSVWARVVTGLVTHQPLKLQPKNGFRSRFRGTQRECIRFFPRGIPWKTCFKMVQPIFQKFPCFKKIWLDGGVWFLLFPFFSISVLPRPFSKSVQVLSWQSSNVRIAVRWMRCCPWSVTTAATGKGWNTGGCPWMWWDGS